MTYREFMERAIDLCNENFGYVDEAQVRVEAEDGSDPVVTGIEMNGNGHVYIRVE